MKLLYEKQSELQGENKKVLKQKLIVQELLW